jgi:hypothetical protein
MTFHPRKASESLGKALHAMGLSYEHQGSGLSESHYITVESLKIRFSRHEARPTYEALNGPASCEIGTHMMAASDDWKRALCFICYNLEIEPTGRYARYSGIIAAYRAERLARIEREAIEATPEYKADVARRINDRVANDKARRATDWLKVEPHVAAIKSFDERAASGDLAGKNKRDQRREARRQLEALIGLPEPRFREAMWGH